MALQGMRLFGVSAIIIIYISGVLFLSMNNVPGSNSQRFQLDRFAQYSNYRYPKTWKGNRKMTIHWCKDLKFLNTTPSTSNSLVEETQNHQTKSTFNHDLSTKLKEHFQTSIEQSDENRQQQTRGLTALASFPGSGNTWLRYLLQQSTGILTGSIYKDYGLLKTGFPAENIFNSSVLIVKTHDYGPKAWQSFSKAILLVRDPEKAILAEFNRQSGGHIGFASPDRYKRSKGKYWRHFVTKQLKFWEQMNLNWSQNFTGNIMVVFYDDLINNLETILKSILIFLEFPIDETLFKCAIARREGIFRRKKRMLTFDPFTNEMRAQIEEKKRYVYKTLGRFD